MSIFKVLRIPLKGKPNKLIMSCPYCNHNVLKDMMVKNFVGIATGLDGRNVVVMECPKCFEYWNYHLR